MRASRPLVPVGPDEDPAVPPAEGAHHDDRRAALPGRVEPDPDHRRADSDHRGSLGVGAVGSWDDPDRSRAEARDLYARWGWAFLRDFPADERVHVPVGVVARLQSGWEEPALTDHGHLVGQRYPDPDRPGGSERLAARLAADLHRLRSPFAERAVFLLQGNDGVIESVLDEGLGALDTVEVPTADRIFANKDLRGKRILFIHNHPSGFADASNGDVAVLRALNAEVVRRGGSEALGGVLGGADIALFWAPQDGGHHAQRLFAGVATSGEDPWMVRVPGNSFRVLDLEFMRELDGRFAFDRSGRPGVAVYVLDMHSRPVGAGLVEIPRNWDDEGRRHLEDHLLGMATTAGGRKVVIVGDGDEYDLIAGGLPMGWSQSFRERTGCMVMDLIDRGSVRSARRESRLLLQSTARSAATAVDGDTDYVLPPVIDSVRMRPTSPSVVDEFRQAQVRSRLRAICPDFYDPRLDAATASIRGSVQAVHRYVRPRDLPLTTREAWVRDVALGLSAGAKEAIKAAAPAMAALVRSGDVLVPIPDHRGSTKKNAALARAIRGLVEGVSVADVLQGEPRESQRERHREGLPPLPRSAIPMSSSRVTAHGSGRVLLVDNVLTSGGTAASAAAALRSASPSLDAVEIRPLVWALAEPPAWYGQDGPSP